MDKHLQRYIEESKGLSVYACTESPRPRLEKVMTLAEFRNRYCQLACMLGALSKLLLEGCSGHSRSAPPGTWMDRFNGGGDFGTYNEVFSLAKNLGDERTQGAGYSGWRGDWPSLTANLSGFPNATKAMSAIGDLVYMYEHRSTVMVGSAAEVSLKKRLLEAIKEAERLGYIYTDEPDMVRFVDLFCTSRSLHVFEDLPI